MIRRLLEKLSRNRVLQRRLPADAGGGILFVSPDAALQFWRRGLEHPGRDLFDFAAAHVKRGDSVWDLGANVGLFAFAAAHAAGADGLVIAVEPDLFCAELMTRSRRLQPHGQARVVIFAEAVGDRPGVQEFNIALRGRASNFLGSQPGNSQSGGVRETFAVPVTTVDALAEIVRPPKVIKIDVESAEALVLRGARRTLRQHQPIILCEVSRSNQKEVTSELKSHDYRLFDWQNSSGVEVDLAPWMTLAVPTRA